MSDVAAMPALERLLNAPRAEKITQAWQGALWALWPTPADWPVVLDLCEAAAYKRMHPATMRKLCVEAKVRHQRIGAAYRLSKVDLDQAGLVEPRIGPVVAGGAR